MIPDGWKKVPLDQVAIIQTGIAKGKKHFQKPINVPYLRVANVQDGYLDLSIVKSITIDQKDMKRYSLQEGDVLLTEGGDYDKLGRGTVWRGQIQPCLHQNHVFVARPYRSMIIPEYLSYLTGSSYGKLYFLRCSKQSTNLASINAHQLKKFPVLFPSIREQKAIVQIISTWDHAIESTRRLILAKEKAQKILMQRLMTGRIRLKGFKNKWSLYKLNNLFKEGVEKGNGNLPLLSITREQGVILRNSAERKDTSSADKSKYLKICYGDIGYNTMRMWQGVSALSQHEGIVSPAYTIVTPKKGVDGEFMAYLFKLPKTIHLFYRYSQGLTSDTWNLKFRHFREIKVTIPEIEEQKAIAQVFKTCDAELALVRKKLAALQKQKRGLMQQLLTGKTRLRS